MTWVPVDAGQPVSERILRCAARDSDRPAIVDGSLTLAYGDVMTRIGVLVARLRELGVGSDSVVAVYLPRGAELVVAATAALVAGAAYLAMDIGQDFAVTRRMFRESGATCLLTLSKLWSINGDAGPVPLYVDDVGLLGTTPRAPEAPQPHSLAYVTYTRSATGVLIEHASLTNLVDWFGECHQVGPGDRVAQLSSPASDGFALEVWACLAHGATLYVADRKLMSTPDRLAEWLVRNEITLCHVPAGLAEQLLHVPWLGRGCLRAMLVDSLTSSPGAAPPFHLYNNYGHTECTVVATSGEVVPGTPGQPSIGRPIHGVTAHVLGADLRPVDDDQPGHLYLAGAGLARGYVGPHSGFVRNPFSTQEGARMYDTGDLVRRDPEGMLYLIGRT